MIRPILAALTLMLLMAASALADDNLTRAEQAFAQGKFRKSARYAEKVLKTEPTSVPARICLAESLSERGYSTRAIGIYKALVIEHPDNMNLLLGLGLACDKGRYYKNAQDAYKQILAKESSHAMARYRLGASYAMAMDLSAAYDEYRKLKALDDKLARDLLERIQTNQ